MLKLKDELERQQALSQESHERLMRKECENEKLASKDAENVK